MFQMLSLLSTLNIQSPSINMGSTVSLLNFQSALLSCARNVAPLQYVLLIPYSAFISS